MNLAENLNHIVGWEEDIFSESVQSWLSSLICPVCNNVCRDIVEFNNIIGNTNPCYHVACKSCIEKAIAFNPKCPVCRINVSVDEIRPVTIVRRQLADQIVKCTSHKLGCLWTGQLGNNETNGLELHLKRDCMYELIKCQNECCCLEFSRKDLMNHLNICPFRIIVCQQCSTHILWAQEQFHIDRVCLETLVPCPECGVDQSTGQVRKASKSLRKRKIDVNETNYNKRTTRSESLQTETNCNKINVNQVFKRRDLQIHLDTECPYKLIECPYKRMGCTKLFSRCLLEHHCKTEYQQHLEGVINDFKTVESNHNSFFDIPQLRVGQILDVKDHTGRWYKGRIIENDANRGVKVNFAGLSIQSDEWILNRLAPLGTRTSIVAQNVPFRD